jgi:hypothetical protein
MQDGLYVPVIGPSAILPRGYLWLAPIWYLGIAAALALSPWPPMWFRAAAAAGLLGSLIIFVLVLNSITTHAFAANAEGIDLGLPVFTKRRGRKRRASRHLPWRDIERIRIARRPYGARVEMILSQDASLSVRGYRHGPALRAVRWILLMIPFLYLTRPTALTTPLEGPPRYEAHVRGITVDELRQRLRAFAPPDVAIAILVKKR